MLCCAASDDQSKRKDGDDMGGCCQDRTFRIRWMSDEWVVVDGDGWRDCCWDDSWWSDDRVVGWNWPTGWSAWWGGAVVGAEGRGKEEEESMSMTVGSEEVVGYRGWFGRAVWFAWHSG